MAGAAGFEPANAGTKNRCLTTWRRPSRRARMSRGGGAYRRALPPEKGLGSLLGGAGGPFRLGRHGMAEMEALQLGAAEIAHDVGLGGRFDPLGGGLYAKAPRERQDRMDDRDAFAAALRGPPHEGLVDLDLREA